LHTVQPVYPADALRRRLRGLVVLRVLVSENGVPLEVRAVQGALGGLTEAAERAVGQWTFEPALLGGQPVRTWATIRIPFEAIPFATPTPPESAEGEPPAPIEDRTPTVAPPTPSPSRVPSPTATPPTPTPRPTAPPERRSVVAVPVPPEPPSGEPAPEARVYRTRRGILFTLAPEQARVFLDARYIGIVDDWDGRGGGLVLEIAQRGPHHLRLELPGFRPFEAEIDVSPNAPEQTIELGDDLERLSRSPYARLAKLLGSTRRYLALVIDSPDAQVSVDGMAPIPAGTVSPREPLDLSGAPGAHDITISSPGRPLRTVRVIVAPNAPSEFATIRVALNPP
jgi:TonB family protein